MHVTVTIGTEDGQYVTVEVGHDSDAFSPDLLDSLLRQAGQQAVVCAQVQDAWPNSQ